MIATTLHGWKDACDDFVDDTLAEVGLVDPPVDAFQVAAHLGLDIVLNKTSFSRARLKSIAGRRQIVVNDESRSEAVQWAVAHEIGEQIAPQIVARTGSTEPVRGFLREQIASEFAGRLLLPRRWFFDAIEETEADIFQMKKQFATSSFELILLGMLRSPDLTVVQIFDEWGNARRFSNSNERQANKPCELDAWQHCHFTGEAVDFIEDGFRVQCWPLHEENRKRELMRVTRQSATVEIQQQLFEMAG